MILEAADCADDPTLTPPKVLTIAWQCKTWNSLPNAGGLLDQPAGLIRRMTTARNVYDAMREFRAAKNMAEWCDSNPDKWRLVESTLNLRRLLEDAS